jgi:hypothetical protein
MNLVKIITVTVLLSLLAVLGYLIYYVSQNSQTFDGWTWATYILGMVLIFIICCLMVFILVTK